MKTEPTAGALRAADKMLDELGFPGKNSHFYARIIDRETGLPEILEALGELVSQKRVEATSHINGPITITVHARSLRKAAALLAARKGN